MRDMAVFAVVYRTLSLHPILLSNFVPYITIKQLQEVI